jgi:hypothetical protein
LVVKNWKGKPSSELLGFETHVKPSVTSNVLDFNILLVDVMVTDFMCETVA